jgi:hypothetical protein
MIIVVVRIIIPSMLQLSDERVKTVRCMFYELMTEPMRQYESTVPLTEAF